MSERWTIEERGSRIVVLLKRRAGVKLNDALVGIGMKSYGNRTRYIGTHDLREKAEQELRKIDWEKGDAVRRAMLGKTLCVRCDKCDGRCSWSAKPSFKPVEGWTAVETKVRIRTGLYLDSYIVLACPEYEPIKMIGRRYDNAKLLQQDI